MPPFVSVAVPVPRGRSLLLPLLALCCAGVMAAAVEVAPVVPLPRLLDELDQRYVGRVIDVELREDDGIRTYEVRLLGARGQLVDFRLDAVTGELLQIRGRDIHLMERPQPQD